MPIKASLIYNNPGLKFLEQKFVQNEVVKQQYKQLVKIAIGWGITAQLKCLYEGFYRCFKQRTDPCCFKMQQGRLFIWITYVDLKTGCVFNGSDLGKEYSAKGLLERCYTK